MKSWVEKDKKRRQLYSLYYKDQILYKIIFSELCLKNKIRKKSLFKLNLFPKNSFHSRIRQRCFLTGRSRSVISQKELGVSRLAFRFLISKRLIFYS